MPSPSPECKAAEIAADFIDAEFDDDAEAKAWLVEKIAAALDARAAKGVSNIRRALVLDTTYDWQTAPSGDDPDWQYALQVNDGRNWATVLFDFESRKIALTGGKRVALLDPEANRDFQEFFAEQGFAKEEGESPKAEPPQN